MKTTLKILVMFALVLAVFSQSTSASATNVYKFKGLGAEAYFSSDDPSGCINTGIDIFASQQVYQSPPVGPRPSPQLFLAVYTNDYCNGIEILSASGSAPLSKAEFDVAGNLEWATLNTTVSLYDSISDSWFDVEVDLTWTATSPRLHQIGHWTYTFGRCHSSSHNNGDYRYGHAAGSISNGTVNFAPLPSVDGTIYSTKSGDISHGCD